MKRTPLAQFSHSSDGEHTGQDTAQNVAEQSAAVPAKSAENSSPSPTALALKRVGVGHPISLIEEKLQRGKADGLAQTVEIIEEWVALGRPVRAAAVYWFWLCPALLSAQPVRELPRVEWRTTNDDWEGIK